MIRQERIYDLTPARDFRGPVVYWMGREQRVADNPGLLYAQQIAEELKSDLLVVFTLTTEFLGATLRQYDFMVRGLHEVAAALKEKNIPFYMLQGDPPVVLSAFLDEHAAGTVVVDFDPLRIRRDWQSGVRENSRIKMVEVDGHNIVPARFVSDKVEFAAYTLRPKIHRHAGTFLEGLPPLKKQSQQMQMPELFSPEEILRSPGLDRSVKPVTWLQPGEKAALAVMNDFIDNRLVHYDSQRNDPNVKGGSDLAPYLHFGQISSLRVAMEVMKRASDGPGRKAFLEELIVRKELSDNFCHYHPDYDNPGGFHPWAQKSHEEHADDEREHYYSMHELEYGKTADPLWNAAQMEMVNRGKMHGYMRMYWAKRILEWTENVGRAMEVAIYLNDKYELDGRDPNGYAGIAWSLGGVHDRAWTERNIFGKIRYMNYNGCKRKFDVQGYIRRLILLLFIPLFLLSCERTETYDNYVILVSLDGCRWDYPDLYETPNLDEMAEKGVKAERVISSFPTKTFPNHYSIATGLYPDHHGLVNNTFYDAGMDKMYRIGNREMVENPAFYGGEPIWNTAEKQDMIAASFFWVGSEAPVQGMQPTYWKKYDGSVPFVARVDTVLSWLQKPLDERPRLILLYFQEPDMVGHSYGPVHEETGKVIKELDGLMGYLRQGISSLPYGDRVNLIITSDHGMGSTSPERYVNMHDHIKAQWIEEVIGGNPVYLVDAVDGFEDSVVSRLDRVEGISAWRKEHVPAHLNYGTHPRISDVVLAADSSWSVGEKSDASGYAGGAHGYDNSNTDMHNIFFAEGPAFRTGYIHPPFENVDIYPLVAHLLGLDPAETDGQLKDVKGMLK
jgi:deoxyribodipyrimidine photo-lyase